MNFLDPKLFYKDLSQSEENALELLMKKYFPDRIDPPSEKKHRRYALTPAEWKFVGSKFRKSVSKRSTYQVKRTWYMMRRKVKTKELSQLRRARKKGKKRHLTEVNP